MVAVVGFGLTLAALGLLNAMPQAARAAGPVLYVAPSGILTWTPIITTQVVCGHNRSLAPSGSATAAR